MSARLETVVERMRLRPTDANLEIGCGHGQAADLVCQRLAGGHFVAIDRSPEMIAAAKHRNARYIASGKAEFIVADLESFDPGSQRFDIILAIRVGFFHRESQRARSIVSRWPKPGGRIVAEFDEPKRPNKAPEPTTFAVTSRAIEGVVEMKHQNPNRNVARDAPAKVVAHL